uniref:Uncharacterized protein n=1 Tax=Astyanax mexicanus TaxID=7994 RepID=A0A8B9LN75_ASTMX
LRMLRHLNGNIMLELSKIAMPVLFNEPLSFLQRLTEYMEHMYLIHQANTSTDSIQRMKCVAAFAVSAVASQWERTGKPFNPLLGETYELIRSVLVTMFINEHGKKLCIVFMITWNFHNPCSNCIAVGELHPHSHNFMHLLLRNHKKKICAIYGKWTECLYTVDPATFDLHKKADKKPAEEKKGSKQSSVDEEPEEMPPPEAETVQVIPGSELVWRISPRPDNSAQYYAFSTFAMQLNELEEDMKESLPTTDCRLRPDIRALENGDIDSASAEKKRLEEKQRVARKNRSKSSEDWKTRWFNQGANPHNGGQDWLYCGGYWSRNYSQLPDIY